MKLLYILNEIQYSGAEIMIENSAVFFRSRGFELKALCTGEIPGDYAHKFIKAHIHIEHIPFKKRILFFFRVYKYMAQEKFDIVHIHTERAFVFYALAARLAGVPIVLRTVHSVFCFKGFLRLQRYLMRWVCRNLLRTQSISISDSVAAVERKYYHNPTVSVWNWVDEARFYPARTLGEKQSARKSFNLPETAFVLCTAGACSRVKRHADILRAMAVLQPSCVDIYFLHLGDGELNREEKILARDLKLENKVIFTGQIDDVRNAFIASDLYIMPSQYEGLGMSSLEASVCGLPALVYDTWGLRDLVDNGINGFIVPRTPQALAEKIHQLYWDRTLLEKLGKNSIKFSAEKFSARQSTEMLLKLYGFI